MAIIKTSFTLRLNLIDHAKIKKIAESQNRSMTNMIETMKKRMEKSSLLMRKSSVNERSMIKNFEPSGFKVPIRRELLDNGSFLIITGYIRFSGVVII